MLTAALAGTGKANGDSKKNDQQYTRHYKQEKSTKQLIRYHLKRYYHADGYIKCIGNRASRTIYSSNRVKRLRWKRDLKYLINVRADAERKLQSLRHPNATRTLTAYNSSSSNDWISKQIAAANTLGRESGGDPWPNCPDPFDGSGSWQDTVNCENGGNWYDSPGYYRCGLQFDPGWEQRFGKLCP